MVPNCKVNYVYKTRSNYLQSPKHKLTSIEKMPHFMGFKIYYYLPKTVVEEQHIYVLKRKLQDIPVVYSVSGLFYIKKLL